MNPNIIASIVYSSAFLPLLILITLTLMGKDIKWLWMVYIVTFLICAFGWEIWFTFGLVDGETVNIRRNPELNALIPQQINWIMNSLADAAIGLNGIFYIWLFAKKRSTIFTSCRWTELLILATFFLFQNLVVELYIYQAQLAAGFKLSWAPLSPFGSFWNPKLFSIAGRSVHLQAQMPWFIMTPLFYWYARKLKHHLHTTKP